VISYKTSNFFPNWDRKTLNCINSSGDDFILSPIESFDNSHTICLVGTGPGASRRVLKAGDLIGGLYELKSLVGKGGMGYVFRAEHTQFKRDFAVKMLAPEQLNQESRQRFEMEGRAIANLDHTNIVKVYDMGLDEEDCPYYVMDLLNGTSLSDAIDEKLEMSLEDCLRVFRQVASGLGYAHSKGIVHRDVKPSNIILLAGTDGRVEAKIVDFGIVKILPSAQMRGQAHTATGSVFGSPLYMSPEQCMGKAVDQRTDIYSLGCTLFETLCYKPPFCGQNAMETVMMHQDAPIPSVLQAMPGKKLPPSVDLLLEKMLAKRPENRYQSMDQVRHDLSRIKQGKSIGLAAGTSGATTGRLSYPASHSSPSGHSTEKEEADVRQEQGPADKQLVLLLTLACLALVVGGAVIAYLASPTVINIVRSGQNRKGGQAAQGGKNSAGDQHKSASIKRAHTEKLIVEAVAPDMFGTQIIINQSEKVSDPQEITARESYQKCGEIKSSIVTTNGVMCKQFKFPDWPVGSIAAPNFNVTACKTIYAPVNKPLVLEIGKGPSIQVMRNPAVLDKIDPGEFSGLSIAGKNLSGFRGMVEGMPSKIDPLGPILKTVSHWPKLELLTLVGLPISSQELDLINELKHLNHLEIRNCMLNSEDLIRQPFLRRLKALALERNGKIQLVCDQLVNSPNLEEILLIDCNTTPGALLKLRTCPQLRRLELQEAGVEKLLPAVVQLRTLQEVRFADSPLKAAQIKMITSCPNIRHLILSKVAMTAADIRYCGYYEPKVSFDD
jgi:serine/threonine protein kinase